MENDNNDKVEPNDSPIKQPHLEYSVGEICKCFYNDVIKYRCDCKNSVIKHGCDCKIIQTSHKCQGDCRVIEKNKTESGDIYTVEIFDPVSDSVKKLPGCCLRKAKLVPYSKEDAINLIGQIVCTKERDEYMQIVAVSSSDEGVRINDIDVDTILEDFIFPENGAPCAKIVMLKADEAFGGEYGAKFSKKSEHNKVD